MFYEIHLFCLICDMCTRIMTNRQLFSGHLYSLLCAITPSGLRTMASCKRVSDWDESANKRDVAPTSHNERLMALFLLSLDGLYLFCGLVSRFI